MFRLNRLKSRLLYKYILSYLLVYFIPFIVMSIIIYNNSVTSLRHEIELSNISKLEQVGKMTDERMRELERIAARISYDPRLTPHMVKHDYYSKEAIDELRKYKANSSIIEELFVYYHGQDTIYSSSGSYSINVFTDTVYQANLLEEGTLLEEMRIIQPLVRPVENITLNSNSFEQMLLYLYPITPNSSSPYGTVMYFVGESVLTNHINNILGEFQGNVYVLDGNNQIITSHIQDVRIDHEAIEFESLVEDGGEKVKIGGKDYSMVTVKSNLSGWTFVTLMDERQIFKQVFHMRTFIFLLLLSLVFFGSILAILLGRKQYEPIKNLTELIKKNGKRNHGAEGHNELEAIRTTITTVFKDHENLSEAIYLQRPYAREQLLIRLLKGDLQDDEEIDTLLKSFNIKMETGYYFVAIVDFGKGVFDEANMEDRERFFQLFEQLPLPNAAAYSVDLLYNDRLALVISMSEEMKKPGEKRRSIIERIQQYMSEITTNNPIIGVGSFYENKGRINESYIEALATMENRFAVQEGSIIYFEELSVFPEEALGFPKEDQLKLIQSLKQGDYKVASETLKNIFTSLVDKEVSAHVLKCICFDIINTVIKTASEIGLTNVIPDLKNIVNFHSINQLSNQLDIVVSSMCKEVETRKESHNEKLKDDILKYINNNFKNYDLSLEGIAIEFHLSVPYVSRFIKEQTGETFTQYVLQLRLQEVKRQLKETEKSIKKIVVDVGYKDVANFTRKFKNEVGITPGQYRKYNS